MADESQRCVHKSSCGPVTARHLIVATRSDEPTPRVIMGASLMYDPPREQAENELMEAPGA